MTKPKAKRDSWVLGVLMIVAVMVAVYFVTGYEVALWLGGLAAVVITSRHTFMPRR